MKFYGITGPQDWPCMGIRIHFNNARVFEPWGSSDYTIKTEVFEWCQEKLGLSLNGMRIQHSRKDGYADFEFKQKDVAMLFKLTFGGV